MMSSTKKVKPRRVGFYQYHDIILGKGNFATVYLARHKVIGCDVALKVINIDDIKEDYVSKNLPREAHILKDLNHPNIIRLYETVTTVNLYCLSLELIRGINLYEFMIKRKSKRLTEKMARIFFYQMLSAVEYMHRLHVIHRDLKQENVLVEFGHHIKIVDFGLSNIYYPCHRPRTHCGSVEYAAPELFRPHSVYGSAADVWSLGVILYAMVIGRLPFVYPKNTEEDPETPQKRELFVERISNGLNQENWKLMDVLSPDCWNLLHDLIQPDQFRRIHIDDAIAHHWIVKDTQLKKRLPQKRKDLQQKFHSEIVEYLVYKLRVSRSRVENHLESYRDDKITCMYYIIRDTLIKEVLHPPKEFENSFLFYFDCWRQSVLPIQKSLEYGSKIRIVKKDKEMEDAANYKVKSDKEMEDAAKHKVKSDKQMEGAAKHKVKSDKQMEDAANHKVKSDKQMEGAAKHKVKSDKQMEDAVKYKVKSDKEMSTLIESKILLRTSTTNDKKTKIMEDFKSFSQSRKDKKEMVTASKLEQVSSARISAESWDVTKETVNEKQKITINPYRSYKNSRPERRKDCLKVPNTAAKLPDIKEKSNVCLQSGKDACEKNHLKEKREDLKSKRKSYTGSYFISQIEKMNIETKPKSRTKLVFEKTPYSQGSSETTKSIKRDSTLKTPNSDLKNLFKKHNDMTARVTNCSSPREITRYTSKEYRSNVRKKQEPSYNTSSDANRNDAFIGTTSKIPVKNLRYGAPAAFSQSRLVKTTNKATVAERISLCRGDTNGK